MKAPIHSTKHYVQTTFSTVSTVAKATIVLIDAVNVVDKNAVTEVEEGAVIKAVYVEYWTISSAADGSQVFTIYKIPNGANSPTYAQLVALGTWDGKSQILHTQQGLSSNDGLGNPMCALRS